MNKHYRDYFLLKLINVIFEYALLMAAYFLSGYLRIYVPWTIAKPFGYSDIYAFVDKACIAAAFTVLAYVVLGSFSTLHYKNTKQELYKVICIQAAECVWLSFILYWSNGWQFSRVWLAIFAVVTTLVIFVKRVTVHLLADAILGKRLEHDRVIVIGSGANAKRFVVEAGKEKSFRYEIVGYMAEKGDGDFADYLGNPDGLYDYFKQGNTLQMVVLAEGEFDNSLLKELLYVCGMYGIKTFIIPAYNDYLIGEVIGSYNEKLTGIHLLPVSVRNTDNILGVNIAITNMDKTVEEITERLEKWRGEYICVSNVHTTVMAHDDESYKKVQNNAVLSLPDGGPLSAHSRAKGNAEAARVTGPDLMKEILRRSGENNWTHFFYGSSQKTLDKLKQVIEERYPGAKVVGMISPPFRQLTPEEDEKYVNDINEAKPDFIWVGLGAPKQEIWMAAHRGRVNGLMVGVGAAFDYESGNIKRAPMWMQKCNLEWLYRLMQDPKRLFRRYFVTNIKYLWLTRK